MSETLAEQLQAGKAEPAVVDINAKKADRPIPMEQNDAFIKGILKIMQTRVYEFHYRAKFRPQTVFVLAMSLEDAREKAMDYCERFGIRFISVTPFFLDLNKNPRDHNEAGVAL